MSYIYHFKANFFLNKKNELNLKISIKLKFIYFEIKWKKLLIYQSIKWSKKEK